jgi:hypothetical protein
MASLDFNDSCNSQKANIMNIRQYNRNVPSHALQPYLSVRPVDTKFSIMPIVDPRTPPKVPLVQQPVYNIGQVFNPGNAMAPWSGYATNVNVESELRNQIYALQSCSQATYVPSSNSDLYAYSFKPSNKTPADQPFPGLFQKDYFSPFNPNPENIGQSMFENCTRQQLKDLTDKKPFANCM